MLLINQIKDSIGTKNSMLHTANIWCNGVMNAYTTNDAFLRDNISWAGNATNWNRFMVTSTLGMIHMGNKNQAEEILPELNLTRRERSGSYFYLIKMNPFIVRAASPGLVSFIAQRQFIPTKRKMSLI